MGYILMAGVGYNPEPSMIKYMKNPKALAANDVNSYNDDSK